MVAALGVYGRKGADAWTWPGRTGGPEGRFDARISTPKGSFLSLFVRLHFISQQ